MGDITNLIQGVGEVYVAPFGETEPADIGTTPGGNWVNVGFTKGGVNFIYTPTYQNLTVDQEVDIVDRRLTMREMNFRTTLAEVTIERLLDVAMSNFGGAITAVTGPPTADALEPGVAVGPESQISGMAVLFDGFAPGFTSGVHFRRRLIIRKAVNVAATDVPAQREGETVVSVDFSAQYVDGTIAPWKLEDAD